MLINRKGKFQLSDYKWDWLNKKTAIVDEKIADVEEAEKLDEKHTKKLR